MTQHPLDIPDVSYTLDPEPHSPPAGDWRDDDGLALDSYFESMPLGPLTNVLVKALKDTIDWKPEKSSRIVRFRFNTVPTSLVFPFPSTFTMPPDPNRTLLIIQGIGGTNGGLYFHSESFTANAVPANGPETPAASIPGATTQLVIPNYTGPMWCSAAGTGAGTCCWDFIAVTA